MGLSLSMKDLVTPTAAAAATETAAASAAPAAKTTARAGSVGPGPGFVDRQVAAFQVLAVHIGDGLIGLFLVRHLDETETSGLAGELVLDDVAARDLAEDLEGLFEIRFRRVPGQIAHVDVHTTLLMSD